MAGISRTRDFIAVKYAARARLADPRNKRSCPAQPRTSRRPEIPQSLQALANPTRSTLSRSCAIRGFVVRETLR
jgi:hypothetical protein